MEYVPRRFHVARQSGRVSESVTQVAIRREGRRLKDMRHMKHHAQNRTPSPHLLTQPSDVEVYRHCTGTTGRFRGTATAGMQCVSRGPDFEVSRRCESTAMPDSGPRPWQRGCLTSPADVNVESRSFSVMFFTSVAKHGAQGKWAEADDVFLRAIGIGEKTLGVNHRSVAYWLSDHARVLKCQASSWQSPPDLSCRASK